MQKKMNILYIHSHDTGRFIQPYGYAVDTPNLQRLAQEGVLFRKAFNAAPTCSPSRACLVTGMAAHSNGMFGLAHLGWKLNDYRQHLIHTLHAQGYVSALSGIQHIAAKPAARPAEIGYTEILPTMSKEADDITDRALEYIRRDHDQPFFLSVGYFETHRAFPEPDQRDDPRYTLVASPLPDTPENRADMAGFKTSARIWDASIGRILDALDEQGLSDNTLVICTTDHGLPMPKMKCSLTDHGMGVLLLMRGPGGFSGGKVIEGLISQIDIFPTVCDLLEIEKPEWLQGTSFMPLIRGEKTEINEEIFGEVTYHAAYEPKRAVRTQRWKYIRRFDRMYKKEVLPNCDDSAPKQIWLENSGWADSCPDVEQLYDLLLDPQEEKNLAASEQHIRQLEEMREKLEGWMKRTKDPLLTADIALPEHGRAWPQSAKTLKEAVCDRAGRPVEPIQF